MKIITKGGLRCIKCEKRHCKCQFFVSSPSKSCYVNMIFMKGVKSILAKQRAMTCLHVEDDEDFQCKWHRTEQKENGQRNDTHYSVVHQGALPGRGSSFDVQSRIDHSSGA